jgi:hypothetical protein
VKPVAEKAVAGRLRGYQALSQAIQKRYPSKDSKALY